VSLANTPAQDSRSYCHHILERGGMNHDRDFLARIMHGKVSYSIFRKSQEKETLISFVSSICAVHHDVKGEVR
jgi:hypothetical protein